MPGFWSGESVSNFMEQNLMNGIIVLIQQEFRNADHFLGVIAHSRSSAGMIKAKRPFRIEVESDKCFSPARDLFSCCH